MRIIFLRIVVVLAAVFAVPQAARSGEAHWPDTLTIGTGSPGGTYYEYGEGLAKLLTRKSMSRFSQGRPKDQPRTSSCSRRARSSSPSFRSGSRANSLTALDSASIARTDRSRLYVDRLYCCFYCLQHASLRDLVRMEKHRDAHDLRCDFLEHFRAA
jgi:hypothetical protein